MPPVIPTMNEHKESTSASISAALSSVSSDAFIESINSQFLVDYDGSNDPQNPKNWSPWYKWTLVVILSGMTLTVYVYVARTPGASSKLLSIGRSGTPLSLSAHQPSLPSSMNSTQPARLTQRLSSPFGTSVRRWDV